VGLENANGKKHAADTGDGAYMVQKKKKKKLVSGSCAKTTRKNQILVESKGGFGEEQL